MTSLAQTLTAPTVRPKVVKACVDLVESEVEAKRGLTGMAIKAGYKVITTLKPGMVSEAIDSLLPEFAASLQGIYDRTTKGEASPATAFATYISDHTDEAADALLTVTDKRAQRAKNATLKRTYERLRSSAKANVATAVPGLAGALKPFLE